MNWSGKPARGIRRGNTTVTADRGGFNERWNDRINTAQDFRVSQCKNSHIVLGRTHTHKPYCARRSVVVVVVHEKQNAMMSRHYYRHARISPPLFFFFFLATCVAFVAFAIDRSNAIRVPDFTTGIKSKFSVMNESVKMMNPKNRRAKELEEREALMKDAYGDDKIVGWDAVNNKPIYDENWSSNKALLEKYNPGSTAREDLPKYKHLADREEEQNWLYRNRYVDNCLSCT